MHVCSLRQYHHTNGKKTNPKKNILFTLIAIYTQSMLIHTCMKSRRIRRRRRLRGIQLDIEQRWGWNSRWGNKFENSGKIWIRTRERSWQRDAVFFFLPSPFSRFSSTIVEVSYIFTHALSGYVSWLHRYLVNVTVDLPWKRILLPNGAGWRMGERWREIWDFNRRRLSISLFFLFSFFLNLELCEWMKLNLVKEY